VLPAVGLDEGGCKRRRVVTEVVLVVVSTVETDIIATSGTGSLCSLNSYMEFVGILLTYPNADTDNL